MRPRILLMALAATGFLLAAGSGATGGWWSVPCLVLGAACGVIAAWASWLRVLR